MMSEGKRFIVLALGAAAGLAAWSARGAAPPVLPGEVLYRTACAKVGAAVVEGFVTNTAPGLLQVSGPVRFRFTVQNFTSRSPVQIQANVSIPSGRTASVGRAELSEVLRAGEMCALDASEAIR